MTKKLYFTGLGTAALYLFLEMFKEIDFSLSFAEFANTGFYIIGGVGSIIGALYAWDSHKNKDKD
ncbi:hypothetical protein [Priestia megaterium]|uniref:hypothetical protein n=1 Tax=Priestia megaterium TaxID=1404 RepID=UPI0020B198B9|nr:hypothetical protein [Priestia megaterium]